jgi:hypothetical protein
MQKQYGGNLMPASFHNAYNRYANSANKMHSIPGSIWDNTVGEDQNTDR